MSTVYVLQPRTKGKFEMAILLAPTQVNPIKYNSIYSCFTTLLREKGPSALWRGWATKFFGYGAQGGCRFGLYEYFKRVYSDALVGSNRSLIFFSQQCFCGSICKCGTLPF